MRGIDTMREEVINTLLAVDGDDMVEMISALESIKYHHGRLFFIGNGGGAGHASHAAADFRKIAGIESYAWGENVNDLTAYTNDYDFWQATEFWLRDSQPTVNDGLFVFSVGGGSDITSHNLTRAMEYADTEDMHITGICGKEGQFGLLKDSGIVLDNSHTPIVEGLQAVLWHMIVSLVR